MNLSVLPKGSSISLRCCNRRISLLNSVVCAIAIEVTPSYPVFLYMSVQKQNSPFKTHFLAHISSSALPFKSPSKAQGMSTYLLFPCSQAEIAVLTLSVSIYLSKHPEARTGFAYGGRLCRLKWVYPNVGIALYLSANLARFCNINQAFNPVCQASLSIIISELSPTWQLVAQDEL